MFTAAAIAQPSTLANITVRITDEGRNPVPLATLHLLTGDSVLIRAQSTDSTGKAGFAKITPGNYLLKVTHLAFRDLLLPVQLTAEMGSPYELVLVSRQGLMDNVTVTAKTPLIQHFPDKTVINADAAITNAGSTVLELLERSPGVMVDRNGTVSLKGRPGAQVMIDGKLTQLSGQDLISLLSGMSSSQVATLELIDNPSAKYDAAGNAGIINIRTKKNKQRGFNGTISTAYGQGYRPKSNSSAVINYRNGKINFFTTYSLNASRQLMDMYAFRTYFDENDHIVSTLEQPYETRSSNTTHNLRTGIDYYVNEKTTLGVALQGTRLRRRSTGASRALWADPNGITDSAIYTSSSSRTRLMQGGINVNAKHVINSNRELTADADWIQYDIRTSQYFENRAAMPGSTREASQGNIPSAIRIFSAKADYSHRFPSLLWEAGLKSGRVNTDNPASYSRMYNNQWQEDLTRSNHFVYTENIHAAYTSIDKSAGRWQLQAGLRYEYTGYKATQLGNSVVRDSSFTRNYHSLFPSSFITYRADSANSFTIKAGRRITRPAFQKLNPFLFIINKYTYQQGNPFLQPQFNWNMELTHQYKDMLTTGLSYNFTNDYFSQVFLLDTASGIIIYTEGNIGKMRSMGLSASLQLSPAPWWSLSADAVLLHKKIEGMLWRAYEADITQLNISMNNQFRFGKGWAAELSGYYITRHQNDLQEILDPTGQLGIGVSKQVMKNKGTLRLNFRDIFYTQAMQGLTYFQQTTEYFRLQTDSRVVNIAFTYRFGKAYKTTRKSGGAAAEEINRVGTVN